MSGQQSEQVFELSAWSGVNLHDDARMLQPGQFTELTNASTDNQSIKADEVDSLISMPVPEIMLLNIIGVTNGPSWIPNSASASASNKIGINLDRTYNRLYFGDSVCTLVPFNLTSAVTGTDFYTVSFYRNVANSPSGVVSQLGVGLGYLASSSAAATGSNNIFYLNKETLINDVSASSWDHFAVFKGMWASSSDSPTGQISLASSSASAGDNWGSGSYGGFAPSCIIFKHTQTGGHVLNVIPFMASMSQDKETMGTYAASAFPTTNDQYELFYNGAAMGAVDVPPFCRIYNSIETSYKGSFLGKGANYASAAAGCYGLNRFTEVTAQGITANAYKYLDFNVVEVSGIASLTSPEERNGIGLDYVGTDKLAPNVNGGFLKYRRKMSSCFFNGYLVMAKQGTGVCAFEFVNKVALNTYYPIKLTPLYTSTFYSPRGVISYNNYLMFYNVYNRSDDTPLPHRVYFSLAGMVDSFSSSQYENISDGEEILWAEEWQGSLIFFFQDKIKKYTGVPGAATLETIMYSGVSCAEMVCKTGRGIFFLAKDGLYLYNGSFMRIVDILTYFDQADQKAALEDGWMEFDDKEQELLFYPGNSSYINVWNAKHNFFRRMDYSGASVTSGIRLFKYYHNNDLKLAISYPGITHVSKVKGGTTYKAATINSGYIDVDPSYEIKRYDRAIIEYKASTSFGTFDITFTFDNGKTASMTKIPIKSTKVYETVHVPLGIQAKLISYRITSPAQTAQLNISRVKIVYSQEMIK